MCEMFATQDPARYAPITRRVRLNGQSTSVRLEAAFWDIVEQIAAAEGTTANGFLSTLHREVIELYGEPVNFASVLRCSCLICLEKQAAGAAPLTRAA